MPTEVTDTFDIGYDAGTPVVDGYAGNSEFEGDIDRLEVQPQNLSASHQQD